MPEQSHPPYGITQPRTLNRWLDVNAQNGPLKRARYFIKIPAVAANINPETAYDYLGTRTFSFKDLSVMPKGLQYAITVAFTDKNGTVFRYLLNPDKTLGWTVPNYAGQPILPNFRIELWPSGQYFNYSLPNDIILETSVLVKGDYRYFDDAQLVVNQPAFTNFFSTDGLNLPLTFDPNSVLPTNT